LITGTVIVRTKHPAVAGELDKVKLCLEQPSFVRESDKAPDVHLYYLPVEGIYLSVVAMPDGKGEHFVVTSYFTKNIKKGTELWRK
jgi:hypothetical protein